MRFVGNAIGPANASEYHIYIYIPILPSKITQAHLRFDQFRMPIKFQKPAMRMTRNIAARQHDDSALLT